METNVFFIFTRNMPTLTFLQVRREQTLSSLVEQLLAAQKNAVEAKSKNPAPAYEACEICPKITLGKQFDSIEVHTSVNEECMTRLNLPRSDIAALNCLFVYQVAVQAKLYHT